MAKILIVDDSSTIRHTINLILNEEHQIFMAINGKDALEKLAETFVNLIICDVHMPVMDGHQLLRHLRADERYFNLPFIMLSQSSDYEDSVQAKDFGVNCYLSKPVGSAELRETVNRLIQYDGHTTKSLPLPPPIETRMLLSVMKSDEAGVRRFLEKALPKFEKETTVKIKLLSKAVADDSLDEVRYCSHALMVSSDSVGALMLSDLCFEMEMAARHGLTKELPYKLEEIQHEISRIHEYSETQFRLSLLPS